ncbi:MAG: hypothetical protein K6T39_01690 [Anoxybacillus ayderensis]|nr:hypothetical protein [Anoxybacillus ayderensis]
MRCVICGQGYVDGAIDSFGDYVCVDCWANGEAEYQGREAVEFVGADVPYYVDYQPELIESFLDACNRKRR